MLEADLAKVAFDETRFTKGASDERRTFESQRGEVTGINKAVFEREIKEIDVTFGEVDPYELTFLEGDVSEPAVREQGKINFAMFKGAIGEFRSRKIGFIKSTVREGTIRKRALSKRLSFAYEVFEDFMRIASLVWRD